MPGLIAKKVGMTQIFDSNGNRIPVTVLSAGPCQIILKRTRESDGYSAVQLAYNEVKENKVSKAERQHLKAKNFKTYSTLREMRTNQVDQYAPGDFLKAEQFSEGDFIDVIATSKGKGFQGVMKRYGFAGGFKTHGCSISHRAPGSIGQRTWPGKVFKGKKMAGQMGNEQVTIKNLKVVGVEAEQNLILIRGAIPGPNHGLVIIRCNSEDGEKNFLKRKKQEKVS